MNAAFMRLRWSLTKRIVHVAASMFVFMLVVNWIDETRLEGRPRVQKAFGAFAGFIQLSAIVYVVFLTWRITRIDADQLVEAAVEEPQ